MSERDTIGSMLISRPARELALRELRASDFVDAICYVAFAAIAELHGAGEAVDPSTVAAASGRQPITYGQKQTSWLPLDSKTLLTIEAECPSSANVKTYIKQVREASTKRSLYALAADIQLMADQNADAGQIIEHVTDHLAHVTLSTGGVNEAMTLAEACERDTTIEWVIPDLMAKQERALIVAPPATGKSTLLRQIGILAAHGVHPLLTADTWQMDPIRVLYVDLENPKHISTPQLDDLWTRVKKIPGIDPECEQNFCYIERPGGIDLLSRAWASWLVDQVELNRPDLILLGPFYKTFRGDPNDLEPALRVANVIDDIRERYGCAFITEAHSPHSDPTRVYGAAMWGWWSEYIFAITPNGDVYDLQQTKARAYRGWPKQLRKGGDFLWTAA